MRETRKIIEELVKTGKWSPESAFVSERAGHKCEYCGLDFLASPENYKLWQKDHIVPISADGEQYDLENIALACRHCNCDWKGPWNPIDKVGRESTREERIVAAREYIKERRGKTEIELEEARRIIGYNAVKIATA